MIGKNKKRYSELYATYDENLEAVLVYGVNGKKDRNEMVSWFQKKKNGNGREDLLLLKSVLNSNQIEWMEDIYARYDKEGANIFYDSEGQRFSLVLAGKKTIINGI